MLTTNKRVSERRGTVPRWDHGWGPKGVKVQSRFTLRGPGSVADELEDA